MYSIAKAYAAKYNRALINTVRMSRTHFGCFQEGPRRRLGVEQRSAAAVADNQILKAGGRSVVALARTRSRIQHEQNIIKRGCGNCSGAMTAMQYTVKRRQQSAADCCARLRKKRHLGVSISMSATRAFRLRRSDGKINSSMAVNFAYTEKNLKNIRTNIPLC